LFSEKSISFLELISNKKEGNSMLLLERASCIFGYENAKDVNSLTYQGAFEHKPIAFSSIGEMSQFYYDNGYFKLYDYKNQDGESQYLSPDIKEVLLYVRLRPPT
jgi:hypothetical protein